MQNTTKTKTKAKRYKKLSKAKDLSDSEGDVPIENLPIPVDTDGYWVKRQNFFREKSFGYFVCKGCKKTWLSAHSFKKYKQGCKGCETENYAKYLWVNTSKQDKELKFDGLDKDKPHDKMRCEACQFGICFDKFKL